MKELRNTIHDPRFMIHGPRSASTTREPRGGVRAMFVPLVPLRTRSCH